VGNERITGDERLDPRIRAVFEHFEYMTSGGDVGSRDELVAMARAPSALQWRQATVALLEVLDTEEIAPSEGLTITDHEVTSQPEGNTINVRMIRPRADEPLPCVAYLHGGGMAVQSAYDGNYRAWGKILAAQGVVVALVDFRNCVVPSSVEQVAPYPAGLNDCVSAVTWVSEQAGELGVDPDRIVVAGDSGGGNLTLAMGMRLKRDGRLDLISGLYALCPYIAGIWPHPEYPSSVENNDIFLELHHNRGRVGYGIEAFEARDPLAWPSFATEDDVRGLPRVVVRVNEADPLRDEGIAFYRLLLRAGVPARCDQIMGTIHAVEVMPAVCPDITRAAAADIARFARAPGA